MTAGYNLPSRSLVSQQDSAMIERPDVARSRFTGSWSKKTTFDAGLLVPFLCEEILPGDHMKYDVTAYVRLATPLFPMMDNQRIDTFFFFVPNRLVWTNWVRFMGEQPNPTDSIAFTVPITLGSGGDFPTGGLFDQFGIPGVGQSTSDFPINVLPFRGYNLIYNQWFRDENLINSAAVPLGDGPDARALFVLRRRAKSHDYFTSCLPWPQKFVAPTVPLGGLAPVIGLGTLNPAGSGAIANLAASETPASRFGGTGLGVYAFGYISSGEAFRMETTGANVPQVFADLAQAAGVTINALRQSFLIQQLLERDARGGTRYTELVKSHFGVTSPDARLQRAEYIGGGSSPMNLTPVAQTATGGGGLGALGAAGTSVGAHRASYAATEHGYIIGLINVRTELSYQQGLHKMWTRSTRYDFFWPSLGGLGEQVIVRGEIFKTGVLADDNQVFGYQERWHEYRTRTSEVAGMFKSTAVGTIDQWHLAQRFVGAPVLGQTFIEDSPPMARVLAAGGLAVNQQYLADILINREAVRPIPTYGTPVSLGRF